MNRPIRRALLAIGLGAAAPLGANAQIAPRPAPPIAEIVSVNGDEDARLVELADWIELALQQGIVPGDVLRTGPYGALGIVFEDRTQIRLHADTRMIVEGPDADATNRLELDAGAAWSRAGAPANGLEIETPSATAAIRGTDWFLSVAADGETRLSVLEGVVEFYNVHGRLFVGAGQTAFARPGAAPQFSGPVLRPERAHWAAPIEYDWIHLLTFDDPYAPEGAGAAPLPPAERLLDRGDFTRAAPARSASASEAEARLVEAMHAAQAGRIDEAEARLAQARPGLTGRRAFLADMLDVGLAIERGDFERATAELAQLEAARPDRPEPLLMRAWLETSAARYDEAQAAHDRAVEGRASWSRAEALRAQIAYLAGDDAGLENAADAALAADGSDFLAWRWRAVAQRTSGASPTAAEDALSRSAEENPSDWRDVSRLGEAYTDEGDLTAAQAAHEDAVARAPDAAGAYAGLAVTYAAADRLDDAEAAAQRAIELDPMDPDALAAAARVAMMRGDGAAASRYADAAMAADPSRSGAASLAAAARWSEGERAGARSAAETAARTAPYDAEAALTAAIIAQNMAEAGDAVRYARRAVDAYEQGGRSDAFAPPASLNGDSDVGAPLRELGLEAWGEHLSHRAYSPFRAESVFFLGTVYPSDDAAASAQTQGLLLDPFALAAPFRWSELTRTPRHEARAGVSAETGDGPNGQGVFVEAQGFDRNVHPFAYNAAFGYETGDEGLPNSDAEHAELDVSFGRTVNGRHAMFARLTGEWLDRELPGDGFHQDFDDAETVSEIVADLGYAFRRRHTDQTFVRAAFGSARRTFENPSAYGHALDSISYSLVDHFGLDSARSLVSLGLYDTGFGTLSDPDLILEPPPMAVVVGPVGDGVFDAIDEDDAVLDEDERGNVFNLQFRRLVEYGRLTLSYGAEAGMRDARASSIYYDRDFIGDISIFDAPNASATVIDHYEPVEIELRAETDESALEAHLFANWRASDAAMLEGGLFVRHLESDTDYGGLLPAASSEQTVLDPRLGAALSFGPARLRIAAQRDRLMPALGTIAPIGVVGLTPTQTLGVSAREVEDYRGRFEVEASEHLFLFVEGEHQELTSASAPSPGARIGSTAYSASEAELSTVLAGADLFFAERWGLAVRGRRIWSEIGGGGATAGYELPYVPQDMASARVTYVHPAQIRASLGVDHIGARFADDFNTYSLAASTIVSAGVSWEPDDRRWALAAEAENVFGADVEAAPGVFQSDPVVRVSVERRF